MTGRRESPDEQGGGVIAITGLASVAAVVVLAVAVAAASVTSATGRAQDAADAAALAAAHAAPRGAGVSAASAAARGAGATLVDCRCSSGDDEVRVSVRVPVEARAAHLAGVRHRVASASARLVAPP